MGSFVFSWFFKYAEINRALVLREHIDTFFDTFNVPDALDKIEEEDWKLLLVRFSMILTVSVDY